MSKFYHVLFFLAFLGVVWLSCREFSADRFSDYVPYSRYTNDLVAVVGRFSLLSNRTERLKSDYLNLSNSVHGLGAKRLENVRNNIAPDNGIPDFSRPRNRYIRGNYRFVQAGGISYIVFDGCDFRVGSPCEFGRVVVVDRNFTICVDDDGYMTYLLPLDSDSRAAHPSRVSLQAANGAPARPWYYVHTGTVSKGVEDGKN